MRNNKLVVYGSSYDRGLEHLLKMWPDVKKEVPEAELHIFYGWNLFDVAYHDNPERMAWKDKMNKLMDQPGITHLGRISHGALRKEFETAGIWAYPTHFGEISCITAMKAQAFGAIPVVINYAALQETVQGGVKIEGDIWEPEVRDEFKRELIALLKDEERQEKIRPPMIAWAQARFHWLAVAAQWSVEFQQPPSIERQVEALMEDNQALKAWDLVKDKSSKPEYKDQKEVYERLEKRVWEKVKHAFDYDHYKKFYSEMLPETPTLAGTQLPPRFEWLLGILSNDKPKTLVDLGCADGVLPLVAARMGIKSVGVNLYQPSVDYANGVAQKKELPATFVCEDLFDHRGKYDVAVIMEVLEHLPQDIDHTPRKAIEHALSLLKKGGKLYLSTPRNDHLGVELHKAETGREGWDDGKPAGHLRLWTEEEFKELLKDLNVTKFEIDDERCMLAEITK